MSLNEFVNAAWKKLEKEGYEAPDIKIVESYEGEILFVVENADIMQLLDVRGTLFYVPVEYFTFTPQGRHKVMKGRLIPVIDESLSSHELANDVNKALLSIGSPKDSDANKKKGLLNLMLMAYHENYEYFKD